MTSSEITKIPNPFKIRKAGKRHWMKRDYDWKSKNLLIEKMPEDFVRAYHVVINGWQIPRVRAYELPDKNPLGKTRWETDPEGAIFLAKNRYFWSWEPKKISEATGVPYDYLMQLINGDKKGDPYFLTWKQERDYKQQQELSKIVKKDLARFEGVVQKLLTALEVGSDSVVKQVQNSSEITIRQLKELSHTLEVVYKIKALEEGKPTEILGNSSTMTPAKFIEWFSKIDPFSGAIEGELVESVLKLPDAQHFSESRVNESSPDTTGATQGEEIPQKTDGTPDSTF